MGEREPPRIGPAEGRALDPDGEGRRPSRFARVVGPPSSPHARRAVPLRLALALGATACLVLIALALAAARSMSYVHGLGHYQLQFRGVTLVPPPPPSFPGGQTAFLDQVAEISGHPRTFSVLDLDPEVVRRAFQRHPWVLGVANVKKSDRNRLVVTLNYRQPVALAEFEDRSATVVDGEGVLLTPPKLDEAASRPLVRMSGFAKPSQPRVGEIWKRVESEHGLSLPDDRAVQGARLAGFLHARLLADDGAGTGGPGPRFVVVHSDQKDPRRYYVQVGESAMFDWGEPGLDDRPAGPTAESKWRLARDWLRQDPKPALGPGHYYFCRFADGKVVPQER